MCANDTNLHAAPKPFRRRMDMRTANTIKEDQELIEAGFEYVTERDGMKIYKKRKQQRLPFL